MKTSIYAFFLAAVFLGITMTISSCHPDKIDSGEKIFNEVKNADEIFGLFDLKLSTTTIKDLEKHYKKDRDYIYGELEPDYFIGVYKLDIDDISIKYDHEKNLSKNPRVKQYYFSDYKFNNLKVDGMSLFFLDNILVGIHIGFPGLSDGFSLIEDFKKKYGDGVGKESWRYAMKWNPKWQSVYQSTRGEFGGYECYDSYHSEERAWKNSKIEVKYDGHDMIYTLIDGYSKFDTLMKEAINDEVNKYKETKNKEIKSSI